MFPSYSHSADLNHNREFMASLKKGCSCLIPNLTERDELGKEKRRENCSVPNCWLVCAYPHRLSAVIVANLYLFFSIFITSIKGEKIMYWKLYDTNTCRFLYICEDTFCVTVTFTITANNQIIFQLNLVFNRTSQNIRPKMAIMQSNSCGYDSQAMRNNCWIL